MNPFSLKHKKKQAKTSQRPKIKSKYFGQYEPAVFIASRSKSKSKSTSKDAIKTSSHDKSPANDQSVKIDSQICLNKAKLVTINPQISKISKASDSGSLSQYLQARKNIHQRKKQGSAIQKIVEWIERKYFEKLRNQKIDMKTSFSLLRQNKLTQINAEEQFQQSFKKFAYDAFILSNLKRQKNQKQINLAQNFEKKLLQNEKVTLSSRENVIDEITTFSVKTVQKAEDFDIYKFKKNQSNRNDNNSIKNSQIYIENTNRSGSKIISTECLPEKQEFGIKKFINGISTMNTLDVEPKEFQIHKMHHNNPLNFTETAPSASTNQVKEISTNLIQEFSPSRDNIELKTTNLLHIIPFLKLKNSTCLCQTDFWPYSLFHSQKIPEKINSTQVDTSSLVNQQGQQILNEIFLMNENQQNILKKIGQNQNSIPLRSSKGQKLSEQENLDSIINKVITNKDSQVSKSRKSLAQNYFTMHLEASTHQNFVKTYEMPLIKAKTNLQVQTAQNNPLLISNAIIGGKQSQKELFTFNSLKFQSVPKEELPKQKVVARDKKTQKNAFVQNCYFFSLCNGQNGKQLQRSNYLTETSIVGKQKKTSMNSNHSRISSRPKVKFSYMSPSTKHIETFGNEKEGESSILFKSQSSHLKNTGKAPIKIDIKPLNAKDGKNEIVSGSIVNELREYPVRQLKTETLSETKERSQSLPHFGHKPLLASNQQAKIEPPPSKQYNNLEIQKQQSSTKNAFVSAGYGPSYFYQSQKVLANSPNNEVPKNYHQSAQSYYFADGGSSQKISSQVISSKGILVSKNLTKNQKPPSIPRNDNRYLYPMQKQSPDQRIQRSKSLCDMLVFSVKNTQC